MAVMFGPIPQYRVSCFACCEPCCNRCIDIRYSRISGPAEAVGLLGL